ncbi:MAG: helix-turn-helix domain-containing protein [Firmicutes bacterium]|nr:helix-turn-helix domain-containing protein [Bacillota bacterium]
MHISTLNKARERGALPARRSGYIWLCEEEDVRKLLGDETPPPGWVTVPEAARRRGVSRATIYSKIKKGAIPAVRAKGVFYIPG